MDSNAFKHQKIKTLTRQLRAYDLSGLQSAAKCNTIVEPGKTAAQFEKHEYQIQGQCGNNR